MHAFQLDSHNFLLWLTYKQLLILVTHYPVCNRWGGAIGNCPRHFVPPEKISWLWICSLLRIWVTPAQLAISKQATSPSTFLEGTVCWKQENAKLIFGSCVPCLECCAWCQTTGMLVAPEIQVLHLRLEKKQSARCRNAFLNNKRVSPLGINDSILRKCWTKRVSNYWQVNTSYWMTL